MRPAWFGFFIMRSSWWLRKSRFWITCEPTRRSDRPVTNPTRHHVMRSSAWKPEIRLTFGAPPASPRKGQQETAAENIILPSLCCVPGPCKQKVDIYSTVSPKVCPVTVCQSTLASVAKATKRSNGAIEAETSGVENEKRIHFLLTTHDLTSPRFFFFFFAQTTSTF